MNSYMVSFYQSSLYSLSFRMPQPVNHERAVYFFLWISSVLGTDGWDLIMSNLPWGSWQAAPHPGSSPSNPYGQHAHDLHAAFVLCGHGLSLGQEASLGDIHSTSQLQSPWLPKSTGSMELQDSVFMFQVPRTWSTAEASGW